MLKILLLQRLCEFVMGVAVTAATLYLFPQYYYQGIPYPGIGNAIAAGIFFWFMFFFAYLYAPLVTLICAGLFALGVRSPIALAFSGVVTFLFEAGMIAGSTQPGVFWIAWAVLGVSFFPMGFVAFSRIRDLKPVI
jgi:hypothetical protein